MSSILHDWYVGHRALEFVLIVAAGVAFLTSLAWLISTRLTRQPASRHLVLVSALLGCLAMPVLAAILGTCKVSLLSIPILATERPPVQSRPQAQATSFRLTVEAAARLPLANRNAIRTVPERSEDQPHDKPAALPAARPQTKAESPSSVVLSATQPLSFREIATIGLLLWTCGSLLLALRIAWGCWQVYRVRRSARPLDDPSVHLLQEDISRALGVCSFPQVFNSLRAVTPVVIGVLHPVIILPEGLIGEISDDELRDILLHELAHISRRDTLFLLVQEVARALYWPIIPVHGMIRELGRAREELCDNHVLQRRDALSYGETLLHLAELSREARPMAAAVGILQWRGELERRIAGLLHNERSTLTRSHRGLACLVALLFLFGGAIASSTRFVAERKANRENAPVVQEPKAVKAEPKPHRTILVHVLGPDGQPMAGVRVHRSVWTRKPGARGNVDYVSDERGEVVVEIPENIYIVRLWARIKHHVPLFAHWEEEDVPDKNLPTEYTFHLRKGTTIGGTVRNSAGQPIKGVSVDVMLQKGGETEGRTGPDMWLSEDETPVTDAEGKWTLDNIPASLNLDLRLKFRHPDYVSDQQWGELQEAQGIDLKSLRTRKATITMKGGLIATGRVTDPEGKPVVGAVVVRGDDPYFEVDSQEVRTDLEGRYHFPPLASGKLTITVMAPGWMPALRKVEIKQGMAPFDFQLEPGKELKIHFVDTTGKPIPGVGVGIAKWRGGQSLYNHRHPNVLNTQIPVQADQNGVYRWTWAPDDPVSYVLGKEGFARHEVTLTARDGEQTVTLPWILRIHGSVTDAATGQPVKRFTALLAQGTSPSFLSVWPKGAKLSSDGTYEIQGDRADVIYCVRIEADGYRSAMSDPARAEAPDAVRDFRLEPAPPLAGRVVDPSGRPVQGAWAYLGTNTVMLNGGPNGDNQWPDQKVLTDEQGRFSFPAQFERYTIIAANERGYAEVTREPNQQPGDLTLLDWARIEGHLRQGGQPVAGQWVTFSPIRLLDGVSPHIQDSVSVKTDKDGRFVFPRVPHLKASVRAQLSVWRDSTLSSSESVPLDPQPGEHLVVDFGSKGTVVKGRVVLSGAAASKIDLHKSLNWLLRRAPGIEPPSEVSALGFTARDGWNHAWTASREGLAFIQTLHTYFVVLDKDGKFSISGVPAGDYDLALRLYEPPGDGCLVSPVGAKIIRFQVSKETARNPVFDLGEIRVNVALGPRPGDLAPDFAFTDGKGKNTRLSELRGNYVLVDFWATWCAPCVASLPEMARLQDTFGKNNRLTLLGMNIDDDPDQARAFVEQKKLSWTQAFLGRAQDKDEILSRYAISSVPTYLLIGLDGKVIERSESLEVITQTLRKLRP